MEVVTAKPSSVPVRSTKPTEWEATVNSDDAILDALQQRQQTDPAPNLIPLRVKPELTTAIIVDDEAETWSDRVARQAHERRRNERRSITSAALLRMGPRYAECSLENYRGEHPGQQEILERLRAYDWLTRPNLLLFGPKGTGKDHLLAAMARRAVDLGVEWRNGLDLFGEWRDMVGSETRERDAIASLIGADVLALSDPLPPSGALSEWQQQMLARVVDGRYRRLAPTWATLNVVDRAEFDARLGPMIADRLRDGAVALFCNWPSYRRAAK